MDRASFNFRFTVFGLVYGSLWLLIFGQLCLHPETWKVAVPCLVLLSLLLWGAYQIWRRGPEVFYSIRPVFGDTATLHERVIFTFVASFVLCIAWLFTMRNAPAPLYGGWLRDAFHFSCVVNAVGAIAVAYWVRDHHVPIRDITSAVVGFLVAVTPISIVAFETVNRRCDWHEARTYQTPILEAHRVEGYTRRRHWERFFVIGRSPDGKPLELTIDQQTFREISSEKPRGEIRLEINPGALGYPWIRDFTILSTP